MEGKGPMEGMAMPEPIEHARLLAASAQGAVLDGVGVAMPNGAHGPAGMVAAGLEGAAQVSDWGQKECFKGSRVQGFGVEGLKEGRRGEERERERANGGYKSRVGLERGFLGGKRAWLFEKDGRWSGSRDGVRYGGGRCFCFLRVAEAAVHTWGAREGAVSGANEGGGCEQGGPMPGGGVMPPYYGYCYPYQPAQGMYGPGGGFMGAPAPPEFFQVG